MGSFREKVINGKVYYEARYTDPILCKQKSVCARTEAECREKLMDALTQIHMKTYASPQKITVAQWFTQWIENKKNIEESTRRTYDKAIRLYILPRLGSIRITDLKRVHCQQFTNSLAKAPGTVHNIVNILSSGLQDACRQEVIPRNPAAALELPHIVQRAPVAMEPATQAAFEAAALQSKYRNVFLVALHTGARISEVLGLQWANVDMKTGQLRITGQLERKKPGTALARKNTTKNHKARVTYLPPFVLEYLQDEKRRQAEHRLKAGPLWDNPAGLIFTREDGSPLPHSTIDYAFNRIAETIGHPEYTLHTLRKTYITNEEHAGTDIKTISDIVGHSTTQITMDVYTATRQDSKIEAAKRRQEIHEKRLAKQPS